MSISQKCQYAMRAIFELARRKGQGPVKIADIAKAQYIPVRFLENILSELKQGGFVASKRGKRGGYYLLRSAESLSIGEVIKYIDGPFHPVDCLSDCPTDRCKFYGDCVFLPIWELICDTVSEIYGKVTFQNLIKQDEKRVNLRKNSYSI